MYYGLEEMVPYISLPTAMAKDRAYSKHSGKHSTMISQSLIFTKTSTQENLFLKVLNFPT
jgi:hypothetical protein